RPVVVRVVLDIDADKLSTIHQDAKYFITTQGILGEKYVEIEPGRYDAPSVKPGDIIEGEPPLDLGRMAANANRVLATVDRVLTENEEGIAGIIGDAAATMKTVRGAAERLDAILIKADVLVTSAAPKVDKAIDEFLLIEAEAKDFAIAANVAIGDGRELRGILSRASGLMADLRRSVPGVVRKVEATLGKYGDLADAGTAVVADAKMRVYTSLDRVDEILADVKFLTGQMRDGKGTIGALLSDQEMYDDIREMMRDLKRHPWKFIWKE
ncbi:MAG: phospholipid/cholesterol/gamma-HCH transport system substrate-binding protein, partial [Myxococcota bacterium]